MHEEDKKLTDRKAPGAGDRPTAGPHVFKRRWKHPKTGETVESPWYFLCYYVGRRRVIRRTNPVTDSKRIATEQLRAALGGKGPAEASNGTVSDVLDAYGDYLQAHSPTTFKVKKGWIGWWCARFPTLPAVDLSLSDIDHVVLELRGRGCADGTIGSYLGLLKAAYRRAAVARSIPKHEICDMAITLQSPVRMSVWSEAELEKLCSSLDEYTPWATLLVRLLRETGIRVGDALSLRWDDIAGQTIRRVQQKTGEELHIPLSERAIEVLKAIPKRDGIDLVFPGMKGQQRTYRNVLPAAHRAMERTGIEGRTVHDLPRSLALDLTNTGTPDRQIAALLGQKTTRIVGRHAHAEMGALRESLERARKRKTAT
jgi:integrase